MPSSRDPNSLSVEDRTREVAFLLATGLRRLRSPAPHALTSAPQKVSENSLNELADAAEQSVTVSAG